MVSKECCSPVKKEKTGFIPGLVYGLLPHSFCLAFIIFTILGVTTASVFLKGFLLFPFFFHFLVGLSLIFATVSALIYLKKCQLLTFEGIKKKWRYLLVLYGTTIGVNLLLFMIIFPLAANFNSFSTKPVVLSQTNNSSLNLKVDIPCPGHAPLITEELKKVKGVIGVTFKFPNLFEVTYEVSKVSLGEILGLEVFKVYQATPI